MWRTFDVRSVVAFLPVADAVVAAGASGLDRAVRRATIAVTAEQLDHLAPGELLVVAARTLEGDDPEGVIAKLDAAQIAGVAIRLDGAAGLPAELADAANRARLPIISFPAGVQLADVTSSVLGALVDAQRQRIEHILDIHHRFAQIVLDGGGAPEIANALHQLLDRPVAVVDSRGRPTVVVPADAPVDLAPASTSTARHPIRAGDEAYGAVVVTTDGRPLDVDDLIALERAAVGIAVRLAQASAVNAAQERFAALSLEELVSGHAGSAAEIAERAASFGWDLARPRAVLLASIDPPEDGSPIPSGALATIAAAARATLGSDTIVWNRSSTVAALLAPDTDSAAERRHIAEALRQELDVQLRSVNVSIGVGRRVDTPSLSRSFAEASRAVDVGRWAKGRHVTEVFDQLGLERLLAATPTDDLAEFVEHAIGPLVAHDRTNNGELVETLAEWLETRNMAEAARRMHVHYNTLKNRLERIEAIIGPVVTDAAHALECEVAIYVDRHYDVSWEHPQQM